MVKTHGRFLARLAKNRLQRAKKQSRSEQRAISRFTFNTGTAMDQAPGYAVGWGSLALINAGLAQGKNRSGLNWFLISLLLGPIATFLIVLFDRLPDIP
jgi:hypothetical protein